MSEIFSSFIGLAGGLLAALIVAHHQAKNTKSLILAELYKIEQLNKSAFNSRKEQWLIDYTPALIIASDPQLNADFDYPTVVSLIHKIQIILNPNNPLEIAINKAASDIGFAVQESITGRRSVSKLLKVQDKLIIAVRTYLHTHNSSSKPI
ncbi:MAG: hypothetical protein KIG95_04315 [Comamonas sp.]|nr:hypothetical protein [Comamonas sp.]